MDWSLQWSVNDYIHDFMLFLDYDFAINLRWIYISGSSFNACLSCNDYFTLDGGMCLECRAGRYYNTSSQSCQACHSSCLTCTAGDNHSCLACQTPLSLHPSTRSCRACCPSGVVEKQPGAECCDCDKSTGTIFLFI